MKNIDFYKVVTVALLGVIAWSLFAIASKKENKSGRFQKYNDLYVLDTETGAVYEIAGEKDKSIIVSQPIVK